MAPKEEKALGYPLGKTPSNSSPDTTTQTPDDHIDNEEEEDAPFQDEISEENARGNTANPPTQHATQVEEKQSYILELIPTPKWSSPSKSVFDHFTEKLSTKDQKPSAEPPGKKQKVGSKKRKRKRDKKGKVSLGAPSHSAPSPERPDDNKEEEPPQGERHFQDEIFEEHEGKNRKIPPTQDAAQVEEKQCTAGQELIMAPPQSPSPLRFDFDDSSKKRKRKRDKKGKRKRDKKGKVSLGAPSHSAPSPERPDDNKEEEPPQGERHLQDEIFEEHEGKNRKIPPTQDAAQVEEKQCTAGQELIMAPPQSPSPLRFDFDDRSKKRKRKRNKKGKVSLGASSHSAPSPERPDDNKEEEPPQGERHFQDEIFKEHERKSRKIPPTQDAAQVEEKQCTAGQELIIAPPQSPSPLRFDFDDRSKKRKRKRDKKGKVSLGASSHSAPSPERPDDNKEEEPPQGERHFQDEIFKEHEGKNRKIPPTQDAAQVEEKQCTAGQELIIAPPQSPSPLRFDFDDRSKKRKRKRDKKGKVSLGASSHSAPSPERPDDNKEEEPPQGERHFQDEIFEEHEGKNRKIPPTQDAAQVEEKQCTAGQELIIAPPQSPSPLIFDFDDSSEMSSTKNENPTSKSPRKEQKAGLVRSKKRRVGSAGNKEEAKGSVASSSSSGLIGSRVFTEEDEIAILEGMIDYGLSHNVSASVIGANVLREFLEGKLHSDFNKTQIYEKIRRFKQKLVQNMEIYKSSGEDPVFSKPHEAVVFDLSKKIWGGMDIDNRYSNTHAKDRISEDKGTDMKSKKNASRGKKNVARELSMKVGATAAAGDDVEAKVKKDHDDEEDHKDFVKNRLLEEIENVVKKLKVRLELAKLELDEMKKESLLHM